MKIHTFTLAALIIQLSVFTTYAQDAVFEWAKSIGGSTNSDDGYSIKVDAAGNVYTTGRFHGTVDFDPGPATFNLTSAGSWDIFVSKLDAGGNFIWAKSMGGTNSEDSYSIAVDAAGYIYTTGQFRSTADFDPGPATFNLTPTGLSDIFISKLNADGELVWVKNMGGTSYTGGQAIAVDGTGNVYTTGYFHETTDFDSGPATYNLTSAGNSDIFISKLDVNGNFVWAKSMLGASGNDFGASIAVDASGNVYTTGYFFSLAIDFDPGPATFNLATKGSGDIFISKLDTDGDFVWAKIMGGTDNDGGSSIALDLAGNIYATGFFNLTADFDPAATTFDLTSAGSQDIFISKLDADGNFIWAKRIGGTGFDNSNSIAVDVAGDVYSTGNFTGTVDFDPGPAILNLTSAGFTDIFISKLKGDGDFVWAKSIAGSNNDVGYSIAVDAAGYVYATGYFRATADFDPGACTYNLSSAGNDDIFVLKLRQGQAIPSITSFTPDTGPVGTTVTITGTGFSTTPAQNIVKFFNDRTATVTASTATSITTTVPTGTITGKISVTTNCNTAISVDDFTVGAPLLPTITSFTPLSGPIGTTVTIIGTNFSTTPANNTVQFNGTTAIVSGSTTTSITTTVPFGATTGTINVTVTGNTATSTSSYTVTAPSAINITTQPVDFPACPGDIATFTTTATGTTNITYHWQIEFDGFFTDINNGNGYAGVNTSMFTIDTNESNGIGIFRCRITGDDAPEVFTNEVSITLKFDCEGGNLPPVIQPNTTALQAGGIVTIDLTPLISDPDDNLNLSTLQLMNEVSEQGALASLNGLELILNYNGVVFLGTDYVRLEVCDLEDVCVEQELTIEVGGDIIVFNAVSPNDDGKNEFFLIQYLDVLPDAVKNKVSIFNRWGDLVFEMNNYNNDDRVFNGMNKNGNDLPSGTYYYKIEFESDRKTKTGYLSLKR